MFRLGLVGIAVGNGVGMPALAAVALTLSLLGFRSCVRSIGARSRAFREAGPERQRLFEMAMASLMMAGDSFWRRGGGGRMAGHGLQGFNRPADHFFGILGGGILVLPQERPLDLGVTLRPIPSTKDPFVGRR